MYMLELTCSFERNILAANIRKNTKYTSLKSDIENEGATFLVWLSAFMNKKSKIK